MPAWARKRWSEELAQYSMIKSQCAAVQAYTIRQWKAAAAGSALDKSTSSGVDFSTSVLIWHIATDMRYYTTTRDGDSSSICSDDDRVKTTKERKEMSRQLSSYIIYLRRDVLTSKSQIVHDKAQVEITKYISSLAAGQGNNPDEKVAVVTKLLLEGGNNNHDDDGDDQETVQATVLDVNQQAGNNNELLQRAKAALYYPVVPHAQKVAKELININDEAHRWGLIADVWVEMLYYTAHLSTGGEFVTHILFLMQILLPLLASLLGT